MPNPILLKIADTVFAIYGENCKEPIPIDKAFQAFITNIGKPEITINIRTSRFPEIDFCRGVKLFDSEVHWRLHKVDGKHVLWTATGNRDNTPDRAVVFDPDFKEIDLYINTSATIQADRLLMASLSEYPLSQVLMVCILSKHRGLMVHSCGIDDNGRGYLFVGNSGYGKSTLAKIWSQHATLLNDDRVIIREQNGRFWIFGTPWHGECPEVSPTGVLLSKIFFLSRGEQNRVSRVKGVASASMLLTRSFPPVWDHEGMSFTLDFIAKLTSSIPCFDLAFVPDHEIVDFIRCAK